MTLRIIWFGADDTEDDLNCISPFHAIIQKAEFPAMERNFFSLAAAWSSKIAYTLAKTLLNEDYFKVEAEGAR